MFSQLPFLKLSHYTREHISWNHDTTSKEEAHADLKPFTHVPFKEEISLKESRYENILLLRDEFHALVSSSHLSL